MYWIFAGALFAVGFLVACLVIVFVIAEPKAAWALVKGIAKGLFWLAVILVGSVYFLTSDATTKRDWVPWMVAILIGSLVRQVVAASSNAPADEAKGEGEPPGVPPAKQPSFIPPATPAQFRPGQPVRFSEEQIQTLREYGLGPPTELPPGVTPEDLIQAVRETAARHVAEREQAAAAARQAEMFDLMRQAQEQRKAGRTSGPDEEGSGEAEAEQEEEFDLMRRGQEQRRAHFRDEDEES